MNSLKEVRPLIEWENYLGVWMVDLLPKQHLEEYTKIEAFDIIMASNIKDWEERESNIYNQLLFNNGILCLEHQKHEIVDNRRLPLIEWEKELGYQIGSISKYEHIELCTKEEAIKKLYSCMLVQSWDEFGDNLYSDYQRGELNSKKAEENQRLIIKDFECVSVKPINNRIDEVTKPLESSVKEIKSINIINRNPIKSVDNICKNKATKQVDKEPDISSLKQINTIKSNEKSRKKDSIFKKISNLKNKISDKFEEKTIIINNKKNKVKVRNSGLKALLSVTLSLVTAFSMYGFSKMKPTNNDNNQNTEYIDQIDDEIINLNTYSVINNLKDNKSISKKDISENLKETKVEKKETQVVQKSISNKQILNTNKNIQANNNSKITYKSSNNDNDLSINDKITIEKDSQVYDNVYSAIDKKDGYTMYYSYNTCRNINYIALKYNNQIIYTNNTSEINKYKKMGAKIVSVCTDDGFYNANDIVKVKNKKL